MHEFSTGDVVVIDCSGCEEDCTPPGGKDAWWRIINHTKWSADHGWSWIELLDQTTQGGNPIQFHCPLRQLRLAQRMIIRGNELILEEL